MNATCQNCKQVTECRMSTTEGAFGPVDIQTCQKCHEHKIAAVRAESRRLGFKLKTPKPWIKLTARGAYSEVRP